MSDKYIVTYIGANFLPVQGEPMSLTEAVLHIQAAQGAFIRLEPAEGATYTIKATRIKNKKAFADAIVEVVKDALESGALSLN